MKLQWLPMLVWMTAVVSAGGISDETGGSFGKILKGTAEENGVLLDTSQWCVRIAPRQTDWSRAEGICFEICSSRAGQDEFVLRLDSPDERNYYYRKIKIDWVGTKKCFYPFAKFQKSRSPRGWNSIAEIGFYTHGWGMTPTPGGKHILRSIQLKNARSSELIPIPVNTAESMVSCFWDPNLSDLKQWRIEGGKAKQLFHAVSLTGTDGIRMSREARLRTAGYDRLLLYGIFPEKTKLKMKIRNGQGEKVILHVTTPDIHEYSIPLEGAAVIDRIVLELSPLAAAGTISWLALANDERLKGEETRFEQLKKMDLGRFMTPEETELSFTPAGQLFCDRQHIETLRRRIAASAPAKQRLESEIRKWSKMPSGEDTIRPCVSNDRRFIRDRDPREDLYRAYVPIWLGILTRDKTLLRAGVKRALALALIPDWGVGVQSSMPGTAWGHIAFEHSYTIPALVFAMEFGHEALNRAGKELLLRRIAESGLGTIQYNVWKYDYIFSCNQLSMFSGARVAALLLLEKRGWAHVAPYTDLAIRELTESMNRIFYRDGGYGEGPGYLVALLSGALQSYYLYARARNVPLETVLPAAVRRSADYAELLVSTDRNQGFIPVNDGHSYPLPAVCAAMAEMVPDSQYTRLFHTYCRLHQIPSPADFWSYVIADPFQEKRLPPLRPFVKLDSIASAASVRLLDGEPLKILFMNDTEATTHKHPAAGNFILELAGETYAMDAGIGSYSSPLTVELQSGERHNIMMPCDDGKRFIPQNKTAALCPFEAAGDERKFFASVDLLPVWKGKFRKRKRTIRSESPEKIILEDEFECVDAPSAAFFWLTTLPITLSGNTVTICGKRGEMRFSIPDGWGRRVEELKLPEAPFRQNRLTLLSPSGSGTLRLEMDLRVTAPPSEAVPVQLEKKAPEPSPVFKVTALGTSHGDPTPTRNQTSFLLEIGKHRYLVDAGEPANASLVRLGLRASELRAIFITHMHIDHAGGLPVLLEQALKYRRMNPECATVALLPEEAAVLPLRNWLAANCVDASRVEIRSFSSCRGYRDDVLEMKPIPTRHIPPLPPENRPRSFALQLQADGKKLLFTGDLSRDFKDFPVEAAKECDVVFCELTHFSLEEVLPELKKLPLRRIVFHHVANRYQTPAGEKHVKTLLARLPYPAEVASDMQTFEF